MRKLTLSLLLLFYTISSFAGEGMWLPFLLQKINEKEMKSMGLQIKAEDIYSVRDGSLKDAVVIFGGGCTGEVISSAGLVLTNHHCGYGTVNALSSVKNDYLTEGFFAKNRQEEIPCPGLSVQFIRNIVDVTADVLNGLSENMNMNSRDSLVEKNIKILSEKAKKESGFEISVKSFFSGNAYYMFYIERYNDIRLVAFPPNGIGKYGGDTDNWSWPRHTGDFGVFRIYADKNNQAANYSADNVPYKPKKHFTINISGVEKGDFAMVYGFPGTTQEYLSADGVNEIMNLLDPARIKIRAERLAIMEAAMKASKENFIKYASKQARIANYYKKWQGELRGLQLNNAVEKKRLQEKDFIKWTESNTQRNAIYGGLLKAQSTIYKAQERDILQYNYIRETLEASDIIDLGMYGDSIIHYTRTSTNQNENYKRIGKIVANRIKFVDIATDEKITRAMYSLYRSEFGDATEISSTAIDNIFQSSVFSNAERLSTLLASADTSQIIRGIQNDPIYKADQYIKTIKKEITEPLKRNSIALNANYQRYMQALMEYSKKPLYPDANFTLRLTYGIVEGLEPQDGMVYSHYTTLGGAIKKRNTSVEEFNMPQKLVDLYEAQDFGQYAVDHNGRKEVPLCFLASVHTTGGNSGSPVLNAYGELIGTNFDRIWEGTMSDIMYDINLCRNISVDIRYTLFILEKFGGAKWLVDEMDVVNER